MQRRLLVLAILATATLAGCASDPQAATPPSASSAPTSSTPVLTSDPAKPLTLTDARSMLAGAADDFPPQFGLDMLIMNGTAQTLKLHGAFDNASRSMFIEMQIDPNSLGSEGKTMAAFFAHGFSYMETPQAAVALSNGTAMTIADANDSHNPFAAFRALGDPHQLLANITKGGSGSGDGGNSTLESVTPTFYHGHGAVAIAMSVKKDGKAYPASVIFYTSPLRIAHIDASMPADPHASTFPGDHVTMDLAYGNDVVLSPPAPLARAHALAYGARSTPQGVTTWTFRASDAIVKPADVVIEMKDPAAAAKEAGGAAPDLAGMPVLWSFRLSEGEKRVANTTVTYVDHDHDGMISAGDTVTFAWPGDAPMPEAVMKDDVTGTYVVPGPGLLLAGLALAGAALLARRR